METIKISKIKPVLYSLLTSLAAIVLSLLLSALLMILVGYNPMSAFQALFNGAFGTANSIANTLGKSIPLIFVGLACAFANKGGIFNIGCEGQLYMGAFVSTAAALALDGMPRFFVIGAAIFSGMIAGGAVGALNGALKAKLNINEVIVAIMLNYILRFFTGYFVNGPLQEEGTMTAQTSSVGEENMFHKLIPKTQLTTALFIGILLAVILYFFFKNTRSGYNIRAVGQNPFAAQASGISMSAAVIITMSISGAIAGLAGMTEVFGKTGRFIDGFSPGYGFTGIAVAVLGRNHPFGVLLSALLFGILEAGSMKMSYVAGISTSMINVMQGLVILCVATPELVSFLKKRKGGKNRG